MKGLELFDDAGVDLRPGLRKARNEKLKAYIKQEGIYKMTLEEYAEHVICGKPFNDLTEDEIRNIGRVQYRGKNGYDFLKYDAPLEEHINLIKERIADRIELYKETGGRYGKRGRLTLTRKREQAKKLGLME